jgi:hypothetical protein
VAADEAGECGEADECHTESYGDEPGAGVVLAAGEPDTGGEEGREVCRERRGGRGGEVVRGGGEVGRGRRERRGGRV